MPGDQRRRLRGADRRPPVEAQLRRSAASESPSQSPGPGRAPAQALEGEQQDAVEDQEGAAAVAARRRACAAGARAARPRMPGRDRADDQQPAEPGVGVVRARSRGRAASGRGRGRSASSRRGRRRRGRSRSRSGWRRGRRGSSRRSGGCSSRRAGAGSTPWPRLEIGNGSAMPWSSAEDDRLEVGDRVHRARRLAAGAVRASGPLWNQAKTKQPTPRTRAAMPCLTWWWLEPASCPGKKEGSEPAGSAQ